MLSIIIKTLFCIILGEVDAGMPRWEDLNQAEMQQLVEEVQEVAGHVNTMNVSLEKAVRHLRNAADYLDQVWKECKIASAVGSSAGITGGVLTVLGGVATVMTAGAATPLLIAGTAFGVAGACTNLGTSAVEASINSAIIQEADGAVEGANRAIQEVRQRINKMKTGKSQVRLLFLAGLATRMLGKNHLAVAFIKDLLSTDLLSKALPAVTDAARAVSALASKAGIETVKTVAGRGLIENVPKEAVCVGVNVGAKKFGTEVGTKVGAKAIKKVGAKMGARAVRRVSTKAGVKAAEKIGTKVGANATGKAASEVVSKAAGNTATKEGSKAVGKAGVQGGAKAAGGFIIGVSTAFIVLDVIDLAFTVRDIVNNEGSDAARVLREKANEYEAILRDQ